MQAVNRLAGTALLTALLFACLALWHLYGHGTAPAPTGAALGVTFAPRGGYSVLVVDSLAPDGPAASAGLVVGDALEAIDGARPPTLAAMEHDLALRRPIDLIVRRGGRDVRVRVAPPMEDRL